MKIEFVYMGSENLGIEYISAALKNAGHETGLTFDPALFQDKHYLNVECLASIFDSKDILVKNILAKNPDLVGFSVFTHNYQWALAVASLIKKVVDIPIIFGGIHPTILPQEVISNDCVDMVCVGEGEEAMVELLDNFKSGKTDIKNIWFKNKNKIIQNPLRELNCDLDSIIFPDKTLFQECINIKTKYMIMSTRGCPFDCSYCSISTLRKLYKGRGNFVRFRSAKNLIDEIVLARKKYKFVSVDFHDDVFTIDKEKLEELLRKYRIEVGLPFTCMSHSLCMDRDIARLLKDSGCTLVEFGIQSRNAETRRNILNRFEKDSDIEKALKMCKEAGLNYQIDHIFGLPKDNEDILIDAARFYIKYRPKKIGCFWLSYFPMTQITNTAFQMGLINEQDLFGIYNGFGSSLHFGGLTKDRSQRKMIKNFEFLFKIIPITPKWILSLIVKSKFYRCFYVVPFFLVLFIDVIVDLKHKNYLSLSYIKYYLLHIIRHLNGYVKNKRLIN